MIDFEALKDNGYVQIKKLVSSEMIEEFEGVVHRLGSEGLKRRGLARTAKDPLTDLLRTGGDYRVRLFTNLKNLHVVQEMGHIAGQRLDTEGFLEWAAFDVPVLYPTLRADVPGEAKYLLPMHQDYATQCAKAWRIWAPLRRADRAGGTMCIVPRSHHKGLIEHDVSDPTRPFVPESCYSDLPVIELELPAGDGILFNPLLVHGSIPAETDLMKFILLVQIQDLTTLADPNDPNDPLPNRLEMTRIRDRLRT